jgi:ATP-dependent DNA ligase
MQSIPYFGEKLKGEWIVEPKIDSWRLQIIKHLNGKIEYWGRRLEKNPNWTENLKFLNKFWKIYHQGLF